MHKRSLKWRVLGKIPISAKCKKKKINPNLSEGGKINVVDKAL